MSFEKMSVLIVAVLLLGGGGVFYGYRHAWPGASTLLGLMCVALIVLLVLGREPE